MANAGPNTNGSQFFIVTDRGRRLARRQAHRLRRGHRGHGRRRRDRRHPDRRPRPPQDRRSSKRSSSASKTAGAGAHRLVRSAILLRMNAAKDRAAATEARRRAANEEATFFDDPVAFREWLEDHASRSKGLWIRFAKPGSGVEGGTVAEAVDQALAFGWLEGEQVTDDDERFTLIRLHATCAAGALVAGPPRPRPGAPAPRPARAPRPRRVRHRAERRSPGCRVRAGHLETAPDDLVAALAAVPAAESFFADPRRPQPLHDHAAAGERSRRRHAREAHRHVRRHAGQRREAPPQAPEGALSDQGSGNGRRSPPTPGRCPRRSVVHAPTAETAISWSVKRTSRRSSPSAGGRLRRRPAPAATSAAWAEDALCRTERDCTSGKSLDLCA